MRVLMIAPQPFFQPRGTPFSVLHRLKALSKLGYKIDLLTYHLGEDVSIDGVKIHRIRKVPFIKKIAIGPSFSKVILDLFMIRKTVQMLKHGEYQLLHSHEEAGFWAAYFARKYNILHLYDMHSSLPQQLNNFSFSKSSFLKQIFEKLERYTISSACAVITICPDLYDYVKSLFPGKKNALIENVADNALVFKNAANRNEVKTQIKTNGEFAVLYAGTFEPYQGIDLLIESGTKVVEQLPETRFVLVGGKAEQIERYKEKVASHNLTDNFVFTGSVEPQDVPAYIEKCDVLVSPRIAGSNTPLKIYSYLRSGKPIVATDHITHTQVLNSDVSVLAECNAEAFGEGILSVLKDRALSSRITDNAKALADGKYSYDAYLEKTADVYEFIEMKLHERKNRCVEFAA